MWKSWAFLVITVLASYAECETYEKLPIEMLEQTTPCFVCSLMVNRSPKNETIANYTGFTLLRIQPKNHDQLDIIRRFEPPDARVQVFKRARYLNDSLDVLVPADQIDFFKNFTLKSGLNMKIEDSNYGLTIKNMSGPTRRAYEEPNPFSYMTFNQMQEYLDGLRSVHSDILRLEYAGHSFERRPLRIAKISETVGSNNPVIFVDAGVHAREWVAPAMALYMIEQLVTKNRDMIEGVDWIILPLTNPDGYEYSRTTNRLWRKTRSKSSRSCAGVDGNRNYGFRWGVSGTSTNPCDEETYGGPQPFSESETQAVRNIMIRNQKNLKLYVSLHSYGQYLVYPWGYTGAVLPQSWRKMDKLARAVSKEVESAGGDPFHVMSAGKWYPAAGASDDYAFGQMGVPYAYTMELTEGYDFRFPEDKLATTLPRLFQGFRAFAKQIKHEFGNDSK